MEERVFVYQLLESLFVFLCLLIKEVVHIENERECDLIIEFLPVEGGEIQGEPAQLEA